MTAALQDIMHRIISILLIFFAIVANARQISPEEAQSIAVEFFGGSPKYVSSKGVKRVAPKDRTADNQPYYVFNAADNAGFVIISGDDRARKILGYSDKGEFDFNNLPPQLDWLLKEYGKQIESIPSTASQDPSWTSTATPTSEGVLLETANWGQGTPYNALCPTINGVTCPAGCTATAMSIIMDYHQWPDKGRFSRSYSYLNDGTVLCVNFEETSFDWTAVHGKIAPYDQATAAEIANIVYSAAVANMTVFSEEGSSGLNLGIAQSLNYYFKYDDCQFITKDLHDKEWNKLIKEQLNDSLPVICGGGTGKESHAFVCDGYNNDNLFHINWGWDGIANGYYSFKLLTPDGYDFSYDCWAIINIKPADKEEIPSPIWTTSYSLSIDVKDIIKGTPFNTSTIQVTSNDYTFNGEVALCLVDNSDEIIETVSVIPLVFSGAQYELIRFQNCVASSEILPTYRLKIFSRSSASEKWKPIHGSMDFVSEIPVVNNELRFTPVSWDITSKVSLQTELNEYENYAYWDRPYHVRLNFPYDEMLTVYINDQILQSSHFRPDYCPYPQIGYYFDNAMDIHVTFNEAYKDSINLKVVTTPISDLKETLVFANEPNMIQQYLCDIDNPLLIGSLAINGEISEQDIIYILTNFPNLKNIDLSCAIFYDNDGGVRKELPADLFNMCLNLESLSLPKNIEIISNNSIIGCERLNILKIPACLKRVDPYAFKNSYYIHHIVCPCENIPNGLFDAIRNSHISGEEYWFDPIYGGGYCTIYVPERSIESYVSSNPYKKSIVSVSDDKITPIQVEDGMIYYSNFGDEIYVGCKRIIEIFENGHGDRNRVSLTGNISFRESINNLPVKYIFANSFDDQSEITKLVFPNGLMRIGDAAFMNCGVKCIDLPKSMQYIDRYAFESCNSLSDIYVRSNEPFYLSEESFFLTDYNATLHVPNGTSDIYRQTDVWKNFFNIEEFDVANIDDITTEAKDQYVSVYSLQGVKIFGGKLNETDKSGFRQIENIASGVYIVNIGGKVKKVLIK